MYWVSTHADTHTETLAYSRTRLCADWGWMVMCQWLMGLMDYSFWVWGFSFCVFTSFVSLSSGYCQAVSSFGCRVLVSPLRVSASEYSTKMRKWGWVPMVFALLGGAGPCSPDPSRSGACPLEFQLCGFKNLAKHCKCHWKWFGWNCQI